MSVAEVSRERVEQRLAALEGSYESFPVNQTTLTVESATYERTRDRCDQGLVDSYVRVFNDADDVLLVDRDGSWVVPRAEPGSAERLETGVHREIDEATGVECVITDLDRVTILGVRNEDDPDGRPVYRLVAVFDAEYVDGSPAGAVDWHSSLPESALPTR